MTQGSDDWRRYLQHFRGATQEPPVVRTRPFVEPLYLRVGWIKMIAMLAPQLSAYLHQYADPHCNTLQPLWSLSGPAASQNEGSEATKRYETSIEATQLIYGDFYSEAVIYSCMKLALLMLCVCCWDARLCPYSNLFWAQVGGPSNSAWSICHKA